LPVSPRKNSADKKKKEYPIHKNSKLPNFHSKPPSKNSKKPFEKYYKKS
jgi:hypothetical protein